MVMLTINYSAAAIGCTLTASRQGYAFARDGGMFLQSRYVTLQSCLLLGTNMFPISLTKVDEKSHVPTWSVHLVLLITVVIGTVFWGSTTGFNAILGVDAAFMIISYSKSSW